MFFPLEKIEKEYDEDKRDAMIQEILSELQEDDPPFLSHLLVHYDENATVQVMEALASGHYSFEWKIKVLRDEWGNEVKPGENVTRPIPINRVKRDGDLVTPSVLSKARRDGSYARYEKNKPFQLDDRGCITCGFDDAVYFVNNWGYNKKTNSAVTKKPEYSYEPVDLRDPTKGMKKHIRYWRYAEMDEADYAKLPVLSSQTKKENK